MNKFPTTPDEITTDWLTNALGHTVNEFRVEPLGEGGGLLGLVARLHIKGQGLPNTLIAKFTSRIFTYGHTLRHL